jgi:hypothetical protein
LDGVNDDEIRTIAESLAERGGLHRLLRLLGFAAPPRRRTRLPNLRVATKAVLTTSRETLRVHVLELRAPFEPRLLRDASRLVRAEDPLVHHVLVVSEPQRRRVVIACDALHDGLRYIVLEPGAIRRSDIETLRDLAALPGESGTAAALRIHRALDRRRLTTRFFSDIRGVRDTVARAWRGVPAGAAADRDALALLLLSRLMFLYFLQRRGLLAGDTAFLPGLFAQWRRRRAAGGPDRNPSNRHRQVSRYDGARQNGSRQTFYRAVLRTLFFGVLNRRPERRTARARALGDLPYLNGGLFERHRLEQCRPALDLDDDVIASAFDALLEKYRFTAADPAGDVRDDSIGAGIDPEMLGRIFEGLMPGDRRSRTGTFYTPADAVDALVVDSLTAHLSHAACVAPPIARCVLLGTSSDASDRDLHAVASAAAHVRILDPACGSGAFLLGALTRLEIVRAACRPHSWLRDGQDGPDGGRVSIRRDIVGECLHGVDLLEDAALICSLRLWLALIPQCDRVADVPPLPNLDRRIRQGDALIDPLDIGAAFAGRALSTVSPAELRPLMARLEPAAQQYLSSGPETRPGLRRALASLESRLARAWLDTLERQIAYGVRELRARASDVDLFGAPTPAADAARARLPALTARLTEMDAFRHDLRGSRALPFFSFRVHFAETDGFDIVLSNPPWVRAHNWPPTVRQLLRERYRVCADAGWPHAAAVTGMSRGAGSQIDLAFLFLERSLSLLRPGGTLGMVLPAKLIRSLAPGGARALLLADTHLTSVVDHSLDQRAVFDADAFTAVLVARRRDEVPSTSAARDPDVDVHMTRSGGRELRFSIAAADLSLRTGDVRSPWLLAPPDCAAAFRSMQRAGRALGESGLCIRRGAMTGANDVLIVQDVEPKLGDLARIRTEGYYRRAPGDRRRYSGYVEASALRPVLRGTDVQPWHTRIERHVLWTPRNDDSSASSPRRLARFLSRHTGALRQPADRLGTLQRLSGGMFGHKVVWSDLASDLRAAAVPSAVRNVTGIDSPIVPMNTVYFIATPDDRDALLLAGYLNSTLLRTFARAIAERAKDAHFRFFAWTIAMLPLPLGWRDGSGADRVVAISRAAHQAAAIEPHMRCELDVIVAGMYGLTAAEVDSIQAFDVWISGADPKPRGAPDHELTH